ncbi:FIST signal transduction protein [Pelagibius marinus]|uniref:FIST signal transduction protein n=1 Tax=Pelagibius marinus TaxID=2762760 RepID=UPI0018721E1E|nr:FIST C-terminal domain-containing protein [Pelagibius marinus]
MVTTSPLESGAQRAGRYKAAHAALEESEEASPGAWGSLVKGCLEALGELPEGANLGFVYATDSLSESLGSIVTFLRERSGIQHWIGTVGEGVVANGVEFYDRPALSLLVAALPEEGFRTFAPVTAAAQSGGLEGFSRVHGTWITQHRPMLGVVHGDPRNPAVSEIVEGLAETTSSFLVGGLTASTDGFPQVAGDLGEGGVSGVLFSSEQMVVTGLSQGCTPIGGEHEVTSVKGPGVVSALDGRPALDVLREDIGELLARDLRRIGGYIFAALPIAGSDTGDYLVRNLIGLDLDRGLLQVGAELQPGDRLGFCRRDHQTARADLKRMLEDLRERAGGAPRGALYFSCVARGRHLFGLHSEELRLIRDTFGDMPLTGFFANGEISNNRLYGYTGVLTLLL